MRETGTLKPVKITEQRPGVYVFDMGQNFAGFVRLKAKGPAGTKIVLRFAEMLNPDGTIYTTNLRGARATDTYILTRRRRGDLAAAIHLPRLPLRRGDRLSRQARPKTPIDGRRRQLRHARWSARSSAPARWSTSSTATSCWTQRANFISIPTDCPQRDERLGWTGDAQVFCPRGHLQRRRGGVLHQVAGGPRGRPAARRRRSPTSPRSCSVSAHGTAAWADAGTICPWTIY